MTSSTNCAGDVASHTRLGVIARKSISGLRSVSKAFPSRSAIAWANRSPISDPIATSIRGPAATPQVAASCSPPETKARNVWTPSPERNLETSVGSLESRSMPVTRGFNHIATLTTDLDRHAEFYGRVFGAEITFRMDATPDHPRMFILA